MTIKLPAQANGDQYEDFVAALFVSTGHFTETNARQRTIGGVELLELDVIATSSQNGERCLVEAKSGQWGFSELFKLYGQVQYLDISVGHLYSKGELDTRRQPALREFEQRTGVRAVCIDPAEEFDFCDHPCATKVDEDDRVRLLVNSWFGHTAKRLAAKAFHDHVKISRKDGDSTPALEAAVQYRDAILQSFFVGDPALRVRNLYDAYFRQQKLTEKLENELAKNEPYEIWNEIEDSHRKLWLQYVMYLEHAGRLLIMNEASRVQIPDAPLPSGLVSWGDIEDFHLLPEAFQTTARAIQAHDHATRLPYLFQLFIEEFGGFLHLDGGDAELLSRLTNIPEREIVPCLKFFDELFPIGQSWFIEMRNRTEPMLRLILVPAYVKGAGCFLRVGFHTQEKYRERYPQGAWLLAKWHSALYKTLEPELAIE